MRRGKKNDNVIGFDPLVWMKDDSQQSSVDSRPSIPTTDDSQPTTQAVSRQPTTTDDSPSTVQLGESLTIEQATAMHIELGRHLHAKSVVLEAGALQRMDAAGLQLLAAFVRTAQARGVLVEWRSPAPVLCAAARHLGLGTVLRLP